MSSAQSDAEWAEQDREADAAELDSLRESVAAKDAEIAELWRQLSEAVEMGARAQNEGMEALRTRWAAEQERDEARECVRRLRCSAQDVLDRWNSPMWQWYNQGPTAELMNALRDALSSTPPHLR